MHYTTEARSAFAAFARTTAPRRADALRALDLRDDRVAAEFRPVMAERREAFARLEARLREIHQSAVETMQVNEPAARDRAATMVRTERQQAAAAARALLADAPLSELLAAARDAATRRDPAVSYALRQVLASREDVTPDDAAPVLAALDAPHLEEYQAAVLDTLGVQVVAHHATLGGPLAMPHVAALLNPVGAGGSYYSATTVQTPQGPRRFRESEVLSMLPAEVTVPPQDARPEGDHRHLFEAVSRDEREAVMRARNGLVP